MSKFKTMVRKDIELCDEYMLRIWLLIQKLMLY